MTFDFTEQELEAIYGSVMDYRGTLEDLLDENEFDRNREEMIEQNKICNSILRKIKKGLRANDLSPEWLNVQYF